MDEPYEYHFQADSDLPIRVRRMTVDDAPILVELFEHLSPESRYRRFNIPLDDPDPDWVARQAAELADLPREQGEAWLAFADLLAGANSPVAGIRYVRLSEDRAEVALVVRDDLQGLGIGTELLKFAGIRAFYASIRTLTGFVQSTNQALWHSLQNLDVPIHTRSEGAHTELDVDLREALVSRWKEAAGEKQAQAGPTRNATRARPSKA